MNQGQQHEWLMRMLSLQTPPVAVKYFKEWNDDKEWELADLGYYRPKAPLNVCQFVGQARHHLRKVVATAEDQVCNIGALVTGAYPFDDTMEHGEIAKKDGVRKTPELCEAMFQTLPRLNFNEIKAIAFAPLDKMETKPDQVIVYGNPLQVLKLVQGYVYAEEPRFTITTCAKYGICVEGMAQAYVTGKPAVAFPCRGERVSSIVQDQEISITIPYNLLNDVIDGFEKTKHLLPTPIPFGGVDQEPNFLPDYYLTESAKKRRG
ncbi:MAG: DUF169 domain-containing protein [Candidatus Bathyarchaeia archaeon]|jgi:uncharacterized protein (DUF169 family)